MYLSGLARIFLALTHVGLFASMFIAARLVEKFPPPDRFDVFIVGVLALAIAACWWRRRHEDPDLFTGGTLGLEAGTVAAIASFLLLLAAGAIQALESGAISWAIGPLAIFLTVLLVIAALAAGLGGLLASLLFEFVIPRFGRASTLAGAVLAATAIATPIVLR
jgi:asparagine N-glycosylation enzyme membrane subunit Stt3